LKDNYPTIQLHNRQLFRSSGVSVPTQPRQKKISGCRGIAKKIFQEGYDPNKKIITILPNLLLQLSRIMDKCRAGKTGATGKKNLSILKKKDYALRSLFLGRRFW
jgi:hypothetical protein